MIKQEQDYTNVPALHFSDEYIRHPISELMQDVPIGEMRKLVFPDRWVVYKRQDTGSYTQEFTTNGHYF